MPTHLLLSLFQALDLEWWWREPQRKILRYETFPPHLNYKITSNKLKGFEENSGPTYGFRSLLDASQIAFYLLMKQKKYFTLLIHSKYFALSDWPLPITWLILHHQLALTTFGRTDVGNGIIIIVTPSIKLTTRHGSLAAYLPTKKYQWCLWLSEHEMAEFLNKSEWNKCKTKENILLDGSCLLLI